LLKRLRDGFDHGGCDFELHGKPSRRRRRLHGPASTPSHHIFYYNKPTQGAIPSLQIDAEAVEKPLILLTFRAAGSEYRAPTGATGGNTNILGVKGPAAT
jgi:hypothetical protein